jgi:AP-3 complex subunit delta
MFEKNLTELIKGIRAHRGSEVKYIDSAIADCRKEIKSRDLEIKAQAILKLAYVFPQLNIEHLTL